MCVTGWRKRYPFLVLRQRLIAAAVLSCVLFAPSRSYSGHKPNQDDCVVLELSALGNPGDFFDKASVRRYKTEMSARSGRSFLLGAQEGRFVAARGDLFDGLDGSFVH